MHANEDRFACIGIHINLRLSNYGIIETPMKKSKHIKMPGDSIQAVIDVYKKLIPTLVNGGVAFIIKRAAGRPKDFEVIAELETILEGKQKKN